MGGCCSLLANGTTSPIVLEKIKSLDLSRHIDYGEYIYHSARNKGKVISGDGLEDEDELVLETIPQYVYNMKNLEELDLSFQYLKEIPDEVALLEKIRILRCTENKIDSISGKLSMLTHLETLDLRNNKLSSLPREIGFLPSLVKLDVSGNSICFIPKYFNMSDNNIELFPYFLGYLPSLRVLYCQRNPFQNIKKEEIESSSVNLILTIRHYLSEHPSEYTFEDDIEKTTSLPQFNDTFLKGTVSNKYQPTKTSSPIPSPMVPLSNANYILIQ